MKAANPGDETQEIQIEFDLAWKLDVKSDIARVWTLYGSSPQAFHSPEKPDRIRPVFSEASLTKGISLPACSFTVVRIAVVNAFSGKAGL